MQEVHMKCMVLHTNCLLFLPLFEANWNVSDFRIDVIS
jgi:hypothetical protein